MRILEAKKLKLHFIGAMALAGAAVVGTGSAQAHEDEAAPPINFGFSVGTPGFGYAPYAGYGGGYGYGYDAHDELHERIGQAHDRAHDRIEAEHDAYHYYNGDANDLDHELMHRQLDREHNRAHRRLNRVHDGAHYWGGFGGRLGGYGWGY